MSKVDEDYILDKCKNCSKEVIEKVLFPLIEQQIVIKRGVKVIGYATPVYHQTPVSFEEWHVKHYKKLRANSYASTREQLKMQVDGTLDDHIADVRAMWPKSV